MAKWQPIELTAGDIQEDKDYFLVMLKLTPSSPRLYLAFGLDGKQMWSQKPGIAAHVAGDDKLRKILRNDGTLRAIEVPADHARRWRARQPKGKSYGR